jgi:uncharacterized protein YjiK
MWGSEGEADGQFAWLESIDTDSYGNVYVVDMDNERVQKFTSDGRFIEISGTTGDGNSQVSEPEGIVADNSGRTYLADTENNRVQVFVVDTTAPNNAPTITSTA